MGLHPGSVGLVRTRERFEAEFGTGLAFLGTTATKRAAQGEIDYTWEWGSASTRQLRVNLENDIACLSPGYKNWRGLSRHNTPPDAELYRSAWEAVRASGKRFAWVDGWNEFHEGIAIAPTLEFGNTFTEITRRQSNSIRAGR